MSAARGHTYTLPSASGASSSASAAACPIAARGYLVTQDSLETGTDGVLCQGSSFPDSLEESSASDSLNCHRGTVSGNRSSDTENDFSDSLEESGSDSDVTEYVDSDSGSFYSVRSNLTSRGDNSFSLEDSQFRSEATLYNSSHSVHTARASSTSSFGSLDTPRSEISFASVPESRKSFCTQPNYYRWSLEARSVSETSWEYASCPDLLHSQHSLASPPCDRNRNPFEASSSRANHLRRQSPPRFTQKRHTTVSSDSMSTYDGTQSPRMGDEADRKKKGLMSSFRKGRKTSRKLRLQKKAGDTDSMSSMSAVTSDGEPELLDSEASAPNSPLPVKNEFLRKDDEKSEDAVENMDAVHHERLNGSSSPKDSAASSMNSSPAVVKKVNDEKDDKKKEKSKFGFLSRKESKRQKSDLTAKSLVANDASQASQDADTTSQSSQGPKEDEKGDASKSDAEEATAVQTSEDPKEEAQSPSTPEPRNASFRSYISSVQFVKNWSGSGENKPNAEVPDGKDAKNAKAAVADENEKKTASTKSPEVTSKRKTTVTIVSKQKESPQLRHAPSPSSMKRVRAVASVPSLSSPPPSSSPTITFKTASLGSPGKGRNSPSSLLRKALPLRPMPSSSSDPLLSRARKNAQSPTQDRPPPPPPPVTVTPPQEDTESVATPHPPESAKTTPPSSPEGHGRDARETPEGDRADVEPLLLESSGQTNESWAGASTDKREHLYKILVIGELGTGKTSIIKRYVHQFFSQHYRATIGVDFALKVLNWDNNTVIRLQLWDIAGQERFGNMTRVYYKEAVGAFVVFDVTRAQTFDAVAKWKTDLDTKVTLADGSPIPAVLLANKCDQPKEGVVNNPARMDDYCRERGFSGWFETSAKENINIDEAARFLVNKILSNEKQGMMMTESLDTDKFSIDGKIKPADKSGCRC